MERQQQQSSILVLRENEMGDKKTITQPSARTKIKKYH